MRRLLVLTLLLAGCGGSKASPPAAPTPQLDPPQAAEPVDAPPVAGTPRGRIVKVGTKPEGVAIDPVTHLAAVAVESPSTLVLVDTRSGKVVRRQPLPGNARHVSLSRPGGPFLVPVETANVLAVVDPRTNSVQLIKVGDHPHDAAAIGDRLYTADEFGSTLSVIRNDKLVGQVPVDAQPGGLAAVGGKVAVVSVRAYTVELYAGDSDRPRGGGGQSGGLGPSHVVVGPGARLAIADTRGRALDVYDTVPKLRFRRRIDLGGVPVGIASGDGEVWAALSNRNRAVPVDLATGKVGAPITTVRNPFSMAAGDGVLAIASRTTGTLQIVRP